MAKPLKKQEKQEAVSSLGKAVSRFVEKQTSTMATYSLAQAKEEKNRVCLDFDKRLKIIENLLNQGQCSKLLVDQKEYQQQKEQTLAQIRHLEQLIELKDKSKESLAFLENYYSFLREFFEDYLGMFNFNAEKIYALSKKESEFIQSFETDILVKIENLEDYSKFIPTITKNLDNFFRDFSLTDHLSFSSQFFFLTGLYPLLKPYRNPLTYDLYSLDQIQYWLQELWLKNLEVKEDYLLVGLLALVVCKVIGQFFERKPIHSQIDKLIKYSELADYFLAEERLKNKLYGLKGQLKAEGENSILFFQQGLDLSRENIRRQFIFIGKIYSKISFIQEKIMELIKSYVLGKQWLDLKIILSKNSSENFLEVFRKTTGIESYYSPDSDNIKSIAEVLIFYSVIFTNEESKEKLSTQLNELMVEFKITEDKKELEEPTLTALSLKDFISFGYLVLITVIYHSSQSAAFKLKENLMRFKGYVTNITLLQRLRDIHHKRQKVEIIKDEFLENNYASCQHFLEAKNAVLDEVTLLFDLIGKAVEILHEESSLISSMMWQITLNGCVLNTEETIFSSHWNETVRDFSALQDHLKNERDYWIEQQALINQRVFIFKEKEVLSRSSSPELNKQKKEFSSTAYPDLFCSCRIFYQNLEKSITYIKSIDNWKGGQREKDQLLSQFSSAMGQLSAHPRRLLKQLQTLDLSSELNDEMITPVLRLDRLKQFTERSLTDPAYQSQKKKMLALIELLNKSFQSVKELSTLVKNVTENYRAINQKMETTLKNLEEKLAHPDRMLKDAASFEKMTKLFQSESQNNVQACWLEKLIKIVNPDQEILTDFYQEIQRYHEYQELARLLHQECSRLTQERANKKVNVKSNKKKRVYVLSAERSGPINQNTNNAELQFSNEEAACLSPNVVEPILHQEEKTNFTLWQIEFEQWRLNYSQDLLRLFSCIDQCFFSTAIQMKVVFLEILRRYSLCLREKQETFLSRLQQESTWLSQLDPVRPIYRRLHEQKNWLRNKIELTDIYMDRLRQCEQSARDVAQPSLYQYVQLTIAFTSLAAPEFHHLLSD